MKKIIVCWVIYFVGCIMCYHYAKETWIRTFKKNIPSYIYTQEDRIPNIIISGLSWVGAAFFAFDYYVWPKIDNDTPASW
jgi:hypothetical protein